MLRRKGFRRWRRSVRFLKCCLEILAGLGVVVDHLAGEVGDVVISRRLLLRQLARLNLKSVRTRNL